MFRHSKQTNLPATSAVYSVPTDLFVMKSRRERVSFDLHRAPRRSATPHFWMHSGERLVNNTKRPRQTNIASGFTGDIRGASRALLPYEKLLYRVNAQPYSSVEMLWDDLQQSRETDKDQTPAVYIFRLLARCGPATLSSVVIATFSHLFFRFVGLVLSSRGV